MIPTSITLDSLIRLSVESYAPGASREEREARIGSYTLGRLNEFEKAAQTEPLDSLFQFSRRYLAERLGEEMFCRRLSVRPSSFRYFRGEVGFEFLFYLKDDFAIDRTHARLNLKFKKQKNGAYEFTPPGNLPLCAQQPEDCEFRLYSLNQAIRLAEDAGLFDIATPYSIEKRPDEFDILIRCPGSPRHERQIRVSMRDGSIREDMVESGRGYHHASPTLEWARNASLVVEAKRIKKTSGYMANGYIHTSHIFQISKIFKGEIGRDTFEMPEIGGEMDGTITIVSHALHIPAEGIFFLEDAADPERYRSEDSLFQYPKKHNVALPLNYELIGNDVPPYWATSIEGYLYPELERVVGQPYRSAAPEPAMDTAMAQWLRGAAPGGENLLLEKGLLLNIWRAELDAERNRLEVFVAGSTAAGFSYPEKIRIVAGYNPEAFGDSLAAKNRVEINRNISRHSVGRERIPKAFFPSCYSYSAKDLQRGQLEITFEKTAGEAMPAQLLPRPPGQPVHYRQLLFSFSLPIVEDTARVGLRLLNEPFAADCLHFDFKENKPKPYAFVHAAGELDYPASNKIMPVIYGFKADSVRAGSPTIVDVQGSNFLGERTTVALKCQQLVNGQTYTRYCRVPEEFYTYRSASHLKFTVPEKMASDSWLADMRPVSGPIYVINLVGDEDKLSESEKWLTILP